ncbi:hypothetical protein KI387_031075, partial [Taxus chinensis]
NLSKTSHLLSLPGAKERLHLFTADLYEPGSFDSAIEGCDFVINLATSLDYSRDPEMYYVAKTLAEEAALQYGKDEGLEVVTVAAGLVGGPSLAPTFESCSAFITLAPITGNQACYQILTEFQSLMGSIPFVHVEDVCNAHIFLMIHPSPWGRYVCCSNAIAIADMADLFRKRYPDMHVTAF